jgi:uracil-DNA glycosylase
LTDPLEIGRRRAALLQPSMRPLAVFAERLRRETGRPVPDADPCDGGVEARLLLLLERPPPAIQRAGFVSRDNATPTARNISRFTEAAGLDRRATLIWNVVPWMEQDPQRYRQPLRPDEIRAGLAWLPLLLELLPRLEVVVLAGRVARTASGLLHDIRPGLAVLTMPHPSPTIVCTSPRIGQSIIATLATAASMLCRPATLDHKFMKTDTVR